MREGSNWSRNEVEAAVASYRDMLLMELAGLPFNKRQRNEALQKIIGRKAASIEFKHQNISAILNNNGIPYIQGYKPRGNFQALLEEITRSRIIDDGDINAKAAKAVARQEFEHPPGLDLAALMVDPPTEMKRLAPYSATVKEESRPRHTRNYVEIECRNAALGLAGEKLVMEYEHRRLWTSGKRDLAEKIDHVSTTKGDHYGYDILSFEESGKERLIEVKTTQFGPMTPFFASRNEVNVSAERSDHYQLYRVFSFTKKPRLFALEGALGISCELTPSTYIALPR